MSKKRVFILLGMLFLCLSCKKEPPNNQNTIREIASDGDTLWFISPKKINQSDSLKLTAKYSISLDDKNDDNQVERLTGLVLTEEKIPFNQFKMMIDSMEFRKMDKMGMKMMSIAHKDSVSFYYKFKNPANKYLNGVMFDIFYKETSSDRNDDLERIQDILYFRWNIDKN